MNIQEIEIQKLNPAIYNPRIITKDEFEGLKQSIRSFKIVDPIIVNKDLTIIGGHQRVKAALELGYTTVPCNVLDLDKKTEKKLNIALNSQSISGKNDQIKLDELLEELKLDEDYLSLRLDQLESFDLSSVNIDANGEWVDMPDFTNKESVYARSVVFHFKTHDDFKEFISKNGLEATDKTRYIVVE